jgi:hypothetical protein
MYQLISLKQREVFRLSATFLLCLFVAVSCKKKDTSLGASAINQDDLLNSAVVDTFFLKTFTISEDSVITSNPFYNVLGSYNDPEFGTVNAGFYTQLRLSGLNPGFGDINSIVIDSFILGLEYQGYYGDLSAQTFEVFEMTEQIHVDSAYYAFSSKTYNPTNLIVSGKEVITPNPNGSTVIGADTVSTQMRIPLKIATAQALLNEASMGTAFSSNETFQDFFKGLYIRVNNLSQGSGMGGVMYFNMNNPLSKATMYYSQGGVQKRYDYVINTECADFNKVTINNTGKKVQQVISDTITGQQEYYMQAFKSRAVVQFPGISNLSKNVVIHKAQLVLPVQYQTGSKQSPGTEISVGTRLKNGDSDFFGIGIFGVYDNSNKEYTIDLRAYFQAIVSGQIENTELILSPRQFITSVDRVVLNGLSTSNKKKPKLIVTYTEF